MDAPDTAVISRIKKLLRLAQDPSNPNEAALAAERVQELLFRHRLTLLDLHEASQFIEVDRYTAKERWRKLLAANIAKYTYCRLLTSTAAWKWIGTPHDVQASLYLYVYLSRALFRLGRAAWTARVQSLTDPVLGRHPVLDEPGHEDDWKTGFFLGAVDTIARRLDLAQKDQERRATVAPVGTSGVSSEALVRISAGLAKLTQQLKDYVDARYETKAGEPLEVDNLRLDGFQAGQRAGLTVPIRRGIPGQASERGKLS